MLRHWFYLAWATASLGVAYAKAFFYAKYRLKTALNIGAGQQLTPKQTRRVFHYHWGTTYLAAVFSALNGNRMGENERYLFANLAALASFFDDLTDFSKIEANLKATQPEDFGKMADETGLAQHFLHNLTHRLEPSRYPEFRRYLQNVFEIEMAGKSSDNKRLILNDLQQIAAEKGGNSTLLFRTLFPTPATEAETAALFAFGALVQTCDDIFDGWFDMQAGIHTPATLLLQENRVGDLSADFESQVARVCTLFRSTHFPRHQADKALKIVHYLVSVTRTCLLNYQKLASQTDKLPLDNRSLMVMDMAKWPNRFRAAHFALFYQN